MDYNGDDLFNNNNNGGRMTPTITGCDSGQTTYRKEGETLTLQS